MTRSAAAARQNRVIDAVAAGFAGRLAGIIEAETRRAVSAWVQMREVPAIGAEPFEDAYRAMAIAAAVGMGEALTAKAHVAAVERKASFSEAMIAFAVEYINAELIRRRITYVADTTRRQILSAIERGYRDGLGVDAIAAQIIEDIPAIARVRGHIIARTEAHGAAQFAGHQAAQRSGVDMRRVWVSVEDHRTRDFIEGNDGHVSEYDHRSMNGQAVGMSEPFLMPGLNGETIPAMHPGDPALPASAVINCRCAVVYELADFGAALDMAAPIAMAAE